MEEDLRQLLRSKAEEVWPLGNPPVATLRRARRRRRLTALEGLVVAALLIGGAVWGIRSLPERNVDTLTMRSIPVPVLGPVIQVGAGGVPDIAVGKGAVWVRINSSVFEIDPSTNRVIGRTELATGGRLYENLSGAGGRTIVEAGGSLWVARQLFRARTFVQGRLDRLDASTREIEASFPLNGYPSTIAAAGNDVILGVQSLIASDNRLLRLAGGSHDPVWSVSVPEPPFSVDVGEGAVWVLAGEREAAVVLKVDPLSGRILGRVPMPGAYELRSGGSDVFVLVARNDLPWQLLRIDPTDLRVTTAVAETRTTQFAVGAGAVWMADPFELQALDPTSYQVVRSLSLTSLRRGHVRMTIDDEAIWFGNGDGTVTRIDLVDKG